jgi:hypothetical protein
VSRGVVAAFVRSNDQQRQRPAAVRVGFNALSIVANCINGSLAACGCRRKVYGHGLSSKPGLFLLWQCRHVIIALQFFFARIFIAVPSYKRPK